MAAINFSIDLGLASARLEPSLPASDRTLARSRPMEHVKDAVTTSDPEKNDQSERWKRLMVAAQAGEQRPYALFLKEAAAFIRIIARRHHRSADLVEDVVQETLTSIHRMRHTYEPGRPVEPWVAAIAKARSIDVLRRQTRISRREAGQDASLLEAHADHRSTTESRLESETVVADAMASLTAPQREAIRLLKIEELSLAEAASVSGLSVQALKSSLHRAMKSLRARLQGDTDE